ncbi:MAG: RIP metalloprotease RseP [Pseudomonadales bacterium]|nr:RIP metalloprotease RseP [Pseudomonadales bacterium]
MYEFLQTTLAFIVTLGLLIFVHEYGHFWVARRCGVRVLKFSIGFGQSLVSWRDKHGTEFVVAVIPLGGFVKMLGEPGSEVSGAQQAQSFAHKSVYQRFAIVSAGPLVNLIFAVFLYWLLFMSGVSSLAPYVGDVEPGSAAHKAGFQTMDEVIDVDGNATESWEDVTLALISRVGESGEVKFTVRPEGTSSTEERVIPLQQWMQGKVKEHPLKLLGMEPYAPAVPAVLGELIPGKAAERQGMKQGDRVLSVNDVEILTWKEWVTLIRDNPGVEMQVRVDRNGEELLIPMAPDAILDEEGNRVGQIGAHLDSELAKTKYPDFMMREMQYGPIESVGKAVGYAWSRIELTIMSIAKMVTGLISLENLSGPITIAKVAGDSASYGLETFLNFMAYLSISLGVLNLLPIPVLDGGHLVYYLVEMIKGSPVSEKTQAIGNSLGLGLLVMFMGLAFYNDIMGL